MSLRIFADVEQGSERWFDLRRGLVTASTVGRLITARTLGALDFPCDCGAGPYEPCRTKVRRVGIDPRPIKSVHPERTTHAREQDATRVEVADNDYSRALTELLVAERITGHTDPTYTSDDMYRGILCEPIAREAYSQHHAPATELGFMRRDEDGWSLGWSPDGLVGDEGCIEIKAPRARTHIRTILADEVPAQYFPQCQAALLVSGREWLDFVSFCGGLPLWVKRVHPDPRWFAAIEAACRAFEENAQAMVTEYETRVAGLPMTERVDTDLEMRLTA